MSVWTNIRVILYVDTVIDMDYNSFKKNINKAIKKAPKITGSETNAIIKPINFIDGSWVVDNNGTKRYTDRCNIVIIGNLRDRYIEDTRKELRSFVKHIRRYKNKMFSVEYDVNIIKGFHKNKKDENRN